MSQPLVSFNFQGQFVLLTVEEKLNVCQICSITNARYLENRLSNFVNLSKSEDETHNIKK